MNGPPEKGKAAGALETPTTADTKQSPHSICDADDARKCVKALPKVGA